MGIATRCEGRAHRIGVAGVGNSMAGGIAMGFGTGTNCLETDARFFGIAFVIDIPGMLENSAAVSEDDLRSMWLLLFIVSVGKAQTLRTFLQPVLHEIMKQRSLDEPMVRRIVQLIYMCKEDESIQRKSHLPGLVRNWKLLRAAANVYIDSIANIRTDAV